MASGPAQSNSSGRRSTFHTHVFLGVPMLHLNTGSLLHELPLCTFNFFWQGRIISLPKVPWDEGQVGEKRGALPQEELKPVHVHPGAEKWLNVKKVRKFLAGGRCCSDTIRYETRRQLLWPLEHPRGVYLFGCFIRHPKWLSDLACLA